MYPNAHVATAAALITVEVAHQPSDTILLLQHHVLPVKRGNILQVIPMVLAPPVTHLAILAFLRITVHIVPVTIIYPHLEACVNNARMEHIILNKIH